MSFVLVRLTRLPSSNPRRWFVNRGFPLLLFLGLSRRAFFLMLWSSPVIVSSSSSFYFFLLVVHGISLTKKVLWLSLSLSINVFVVDIDNIFICFINSVNHFVKKAVISGKLGFKLDFDGEWWRQAVRIPLDEFANWVMNSEFLLMLSILIRIRFY